tara:strand:- start:69 stop:464 length:396 start_codon:yes stop_codon:yes gene_type:complete
MSWKDILKNRKTYSEFDLEELAPYWWGDLLQSIRNEGEDNAEEFDGDVYQDAWHKYTNDENWLKNLEWWRSWYSVSDTEEEVREKVLRFEPDRLKDFRFGNQRLKPSSSSYNPNPELRALDRSPPASYYED